MSEGPSWVEEVEVRRREEFDDQSDRRVKPFLRALDEIDVVDIERLKRMRPSISTKSKSE